MIKIVNLSFSTVQAVRSWRKILHFMTKKAMASHSVGNAIDNDLNMNRIHLVWKRINSLELYRRITDWIFTQMIRHKKTYIDEQFIKKSNQHKLISRYTRIQSDWFFINRQLDDSNHLTKEQFNSFRCEEIAFNSFLIFSSLNASFTSSA